MTDADIKKLAEVDQRSRSNEHRLDNLEDDVADLRKEQSAIYQLAASVQVIAEQTKTTSADVKSLSAKIDEQGKKIDKQDKDRVSAEKALEDKIVAVQSAPAVEKADTLDKVRVAVITAVCSGIATLILGKLLGM